MSVGGKLKLERGFYVFFGQIGRAVLLGGVLEFRGECEPVVHGGPIDRDFCGTLGPKYLGFLVWDKARPPCQIIKSTGGAVMILSTVVFAFGLVICGIVALGIQNAREIAGQIEARQLAFVRQQAEWEVVSEKAARRHIRSRERAA